jgi:hypothetical protein
VCVGETLAERDGGETLAVRIFNFLHYGHNSQVNALCLLLLLLALAPILLWKLKQWLRTERSLKNANDIRDLIEQLLFTMPGERVNRPSFGTGLMQLVFEPTSREIATAVEFLVQSSLQQFLGDLITVAPVTVTSEESSIEVAVEYRVRRTDDRRIDQFTRSA